METNWSAIVVLLLVTWIAVYISRLWFKAWFNPLSVYSFVWGCALCGYELRLIQYERISKGAWICIVAAWASLYLGAGTALLFHPAPKRDTQPDLPVGLGFLKKVIIVLTVVGGTAVFDELRVIRGEFGGLLQALLFNANDIYRGKLEGSLGWMPYASAFLYSACVLSGVYTAKKGKITPLALLPLVVITVNNIFSMIRAGAMMAIFLFVIGFLYTPHQAQFAFTRRQRLLAVGLGVIVLISGLAVVSATRGLGVDYPGMTPAMDRITEYVPIFPSLYSYISATPVAFSQYLATPEETKHGFFGAYTFRPFYRMLARMGFPTDVSYFEEDYYTPVPMNTSTYLKNIHSDFGFLGIVFFPYFLGMSAAVLIVRAKERPGLVGVVLLSNLYLIIIFSFMVNLMVLGDWYISIMVGIAVAVLIGRRSEVMKNAKATMPGGLNIGLS